MAPSPVICNGGLMWYQSLIIDLSAVVVRSRHLLDNVACYQYGQWIRGVIYLKSSWVIAMFYVHRWWVSRWIVVCGERIIDSRTNFNGRKKCSGQTYQPYQSSIQYRANGRQLEIHRSAGISSIRGVG